MNAKDVGRRLWDTDGTRRVLFGCAICCGSPRLAELVGRVGFDVVWIDMEHTSADLRAAEGMCVAAEAGGAIPLVRTAGYDRIAILHALEIGAEMLAVPMVNDAATAEQVARFSRYPPMGIRGYNTRARAADFGLDKPAERMKRANEQMVVLPQIESRLAVGNLDAILAVRGIDGIFVGPGDLSADLGCPGDFSNPQLVAMVCDCVRRARAAGRHAGILCGGPLAEKAIAAGADLCICASDMGPMIDAWGKQLASLRKIAAGSE